MKITDIQIDRFGVWQNLSLSLANPGLSVFYGPNEAGKSTMMRFVRGILYGYKPEAGASFGSPGPTMPWEGALRIEQNGQTGEIRRSAQHDPRGRLHISGLDRDASDEEILEELLANTPEALYQNVFAIGLHELQELATLHGEEVARHIYGLSLGPEGRQLLDATSQLDEQSRTLLDPQTGIGELADLFAEYDHIASEIQDRENVRQKYADFCKDRDRLNAQIEDLKHRQEGIQSQLSGHMFLERVWRPWNEVREFEAELEKLPYVVGFPEIGLQRLEELEDELDTATRCRDTLLNEAAELRKQADDLSPDPELQKHSATVQSFVDQRQWIADLRTEIDAADARVGELEDSLEHHLEQLGPEWSIERLENVNTNPAAHYRMVNMARGYQSALKKRSKLRRRIQRLSDVSQDGMAQLADELKKFGCETAQEALSAARKKLADLDKLSRLKLRETELDQRRTGIREQLERLQNRPSLPKWVWGVLVLFAVMGVILAVAGISTGVTTSGIGGIAYALLGITCGGLSWALKTHFEAEVRDSLEQLQDEAEQNDVQLRETRQQIERLTPDSQFSDPSAGNLDSYFEQQAEALDASAPSGEHFSATLSENSDADLIKQSAHQLVALEQLAQTEQRIQKQRRRLSELRSRFQAAQRDVSTARQNWCELLTQLGLSETVRIDEAFQSWQKVAEANEKRRLWEAARTELNHRQKTWETYRQRIEELGHRMDCWNLDYNRPLDVLATWEDQLRRYAENRAERRRLQKEEKTRRREAAGYQEKIDELKMQRSALLVQGGASSRDEFERRANWIERRQELEMFLEAARGELEAARISEPDLAIVEEDLQAYDAEQNSECIKTLNLELEDLELDLQQAFEDLGSVKQELKTLENDRLTTKLRFEREQSRQKLKAETERWFATQLAAQAVARIRRRFERTCQPETLAAASHYLERLTCGKYRNVWTPLGQQHLCIEDDHDHALQVEQLSNGTREQLFLAIRLALVEQLRRDGVHLPMILDDVIVNFDQLRTEAAVDLLIDFAEKGQQILLFTCHLHLAHLFESRQINPFWLPGHNPAVEERRAG